MTLITAIMSGGRNLSQAHFKRWKFRSRVEQGQQTASVSLSEHFQRPLGPEPRLPIFTKPPASSPRPLLLQSPPALILHPQLPPPKGQELEEAVAGEKTRPKRIVLLVLTGSPL